MSHEENKIVSKKRYEKSLANLHDYIEDIENYLDVTHMALLVAVEDIWQSCSLAQRRREDLVKFKVRRFAIWNREARERLDNAETARRPGRNSGPISASEKNLLDALTKIKETAEGWQGQDVAPYWNLGDIAAAALNRHNTDQGVDLEHEFDVYHLALRVAAEAAAVVEPTRTADEYIKLWRTTAQRDARAAMEATDES